MAIMIKGMEMPEKCGSCDLFHVESPMHCTVVKGHKTVGAPYGMPRPDWCPLVEVPAEPRTGKWVLMSDCTGKYYACSWCGHDGYSGMHYCPNCGAKMEESE